MPQAFETAELIKAIQEGKTMEEIVELDIVIIRISTVEQLDTGGKPTVDRSDRDEFGRKVDRRSEFRWDVYKKSGAYYTWNSTILFPGGCD